MAILDPIFCLVLLTFIVGLALGASRLIGSKKGHLDRRYLKLMSDFEVPEYSKKIERNFSNLFEAPVLFYLVCVLSLVLDISSQLLVYLAWGFVVLRIIHTAIHVTYNNSFHRFLAFLFSSLVLLAMWLELYTLID